MKPNRKSLSRRLILPLMLANPAGRLLADRLSSGATAWAVHDAVLHFHLTSCLWAVFVLIGYRHTRLKCAVLAVFAFELYAAVESTANAVWPQIGGLGLPLHAALTSLTLTWYLFRTYNPSSDTLTDSDLFICRLRPRSAQDLFLAMFGKSALGGVALYYRGQMYHYSRGVLVKTSPGNLSRYVTRRAGVPTSQQLQYLETLVGERWTLTRNCMTQLYPLAKIGRPLRRSNLT